MLSNLSRTTQPELARVTGAKRPYTHIRTTAPPKIMIEKTYIKWCSYAWTPCDLGVIPGEEINKIRYKITCAALPRPWGLSSSPLLLSEEGLTDSLIPHGVTQFFKRLLYQTYHNCSCRPSYRHHLNNNPYGLLLAWTVSLHSERRV